MSWPARSAHGVALRYEVRAMAKTTRLSPLKGLLSKSALSKADIAEAMRVSESTITAWERSLEGATPLQLRDLAFLLSTSVEALRGVEASEKEMADGTFAAHVPRGKFYGTLKLSLAGLDLEYPVDESARDALLVQLQDFDIQEYDKKPDWISASTMDNRIVFANVSFLQQVELLGDDVEEMPSYEHPEVYNALEDWELEEEIGPAIRWRCERVFEERDPDEVIEAVTHTRMVMGDGSVIWQPLVEEEDTLAYFLVDLEGASGLARNRLVRVVDEGYFRARYVNLSNVAVIEVPANRYFRLLAASEYKDTASSGGVSAGTTG
jgi:transcriptional regulator with XRE-family HTH domain